MSVGFQHPNAKVHVCDGFKFLEEQKNQFDVIITDSSDPEGPAEVLFQKPYFELLYGALREGGVISTQGCSSPLRPLLVSFALCFHLLPLRFGLRRYPDFILHFRLHFARSLCRLLFLSLFSFTKKVTSSLITDQANHTNHFTSRVSH